MSCLRICSLALLGLEAQSRTTSSSEERFDVSEIQIHLQSSQVTIVMYPTIVTLKKSGLWVEIQIHSL